MALKNHCEGHQTRLTNTHIWNDDSRYCMKACFPADIKQWTVTVQQYNQLTNGNNNKSSFLRHLEHATQRTLLLMHYKLFLIFLTLTSLQNRIQERFKAPQQTDSSISEQMKGSCNNNRQQQRWMGGNG